MAEVIQLPCDVPGVGRCGDYIVHDPDHPNPSIRYARIQPITAEAFAGAQDIVNRHSPHLSWVGRPTHLHLVTEETP